MAANCPKSNPSNRGAAKYGVSLSKAADSSWALLEALAPSHLGLSVLVVELGSGHCSEAHGIFSPPITGLITGLIVSLAGLIELSPFISWLVNRVSSSYQVH